MVPVMTFCKITSHTLNSKYIQCYMYSLIKTYNNNILNYFQIFKLTSFALCLIFARVICHTIASWYPLDIGILKRKKFDWGFASVSSDFRDEVQLYNSLRLMRNMYGCTYSKKTIGLRISLIDLCNENFHWL